MNDQLRFFANRVGEKLWVKPLAICMLSIAAAFIAKTADGSGLVEFVPDITSDSLETLLKVISASMLVMAVFAVGSMLAAYESASNSATPRAFSLVIADDVSQNALSTFVGSFIFSVVALVALLNDYYQIAGRFTLFLFIILVFAIVIISFLRWVDCIARLGRLGTTITKVEDATRETLLRQRKYPTLRAVRSDRRQEGFPIYSREIGYIQRIDVPALQTAAEKLDMRVEVALLPGSFSFPAQPIAYVSTADGNQLDTEDAVAITAAFLIDKERTFDEDPRFGLIVLSEIASRALSPAVNDPGTAICILGTLVRLFTTWSEETGDGSDGASVIEFDRVAVPEVSMDDLFNDAFHAIARDGAGCVEVVMRLQRALGALSKVGDQDMRQCAEHYARVSLAYAEKALGLSEEIARVRSLSEVSQ